ncbi:hypothetical protein ACWCP6_26875 [Streptomyces sp. NPDC002004]
MERSGGRASAGDRHWRGAARFAVLCSLLFLCMATLTDWNAGTLTLPRAGIWLALAALVFSVLLPPRVTAGGGWLTVRGPLHAHRVRLDALAGVRQDGDVAARLVLWDVHGRRLCLDPRVLVDNPFLWHELETGGRRSLERGTLRYGAGLLRRLGEHMDGGEARAILRASGME